MEVKCRLNGENIILRGEPTDRLRDVLYHTGCYSVRDSDDAEGFAGSDTVISVSYTHLTLPTNSIV